MEGAGGATGKCRNLESDPERSLGGRGQFLQISGEGYLQGCPAAEGKDQVTEARAGAGGEAERARKNFSGSSCPAPGSIDQQPAAEGVPVGASRGGPVERRGF